MVKFPHKRREQIWAYIRKNHHSVVEATNEKCETHYANLQRPTSFINRDFLPSTASVLCLAFIDTDNIITTEPFKPWARIDAATCASERNLHENKQKELQHLITRGRAALQTLRDREVVARSERHAPADEERAVAHKAAAEQKQARQEREQNRQHLVHSLFFSCLCVVC